MKALIAMSGGVDSSVSALLMKEKGYPCIDCNRYMKFDKLYDRAKEYGCQYIVTGHYARIEENKEGYLLKKAIDDTKDQSYVLYSMTQDQLAHTKFPMGDLRKSQARLLAEENGLINAAKPDSQDICFVPDGDYAGAIQRLSGKEYEIGLIKDIDGKILGEHRGIIHYTIGQRKGLGISAEQPLYVCRIDEKNNEVIVGGVESLFSDQIQIKDVNWISPWLIKDGMSVKAKIRYRQKEEPAVLHLNRDFKDTATINFLKPQRAVTKGQAAVLYLDDIVLGGGIIS